MGKLATVVHNRFHWILAAFVFPLVLLALTPRLEANEPARALLLHWKARPPAGLLASARERLIDDDITVSAKRVPKEPTVGEAQAIMNLAEAMAVFWVNDEGHLYLLVAVEGGAKQYHATKGTPEEQGTYLEAALQSHKPYEEDLWDRVLVTVPGSLVEDTSRPPTPSRPKSDAKQSRAEAEPLKKGWVGAGYRMRIHLDSITWLQHGVNLEVPSWYLERNIVLRASAMIHFPSRIGNVEDGDWLELRSVGIAIGLGVFLWRRGPFSLELGGGFGSEMVTATAVFFSGESQDDRHVSGLFMAWASVAWEISDMTKFRLHFDNLIAINAKGYSLYGRGDFGSSVWQPVVVLDFSFAVFG